MSDQKKLAPVMDDLKGDKLEAGKLMDVRQGQSGGQEGAQRRVRPIQAVRRRQSRRAGRRPLFH